MDLEVVRPKITQPAEELTHQLAAPLPSSLPTGTVERHVVGPGLAHSDVIVKEPLSLI